MAGKAVFRADASPHIGGGHVMRCLTLADELAGRGWECVFAVNPEAAQTVPQLAKFKTTAPDGWDGADCLIADHYGLDAAYEASCRGKAGKVVVLDDLADRAHDCDILMDQTLGRKKEDYRPLVPARCRMFLGPDYALLRSQFALARDAALARRRGTIERALVTFGSVDEHNAAGMALEAIDPDIAVDVVIGKSAPHLESVRAQAEKRKNAQFHVATDDMAALMTAADICIGAGGTTSWERCCLGLPTILIEIADNQQTNARRLSGAGAALALGKLPFVNAETIREALQNLRQSPEKLIKMAEDAARICDGLGAQRLADGIING